MKKNILPSHKFDIITRALKDGFASNISSINKQEIYRSPTMDSFIYNFKNGEKAGIFNIGLYRNPYDTGSVVYELRMIIGQIMNYLDNCETYNEMNEKLNRYLSENKLVCRQDIDGNYDMTNFYPITRFSL